jgi:hypothetical protein
MNVNLMKNPSIYYDIARGFVLQRKKSIATSAVW